jgi:hypothetical protein
VLNWHISTILSEMSIHPNTIVSTRDGFGWPRRSRTSLKNQPIPTYYEDAGFEELTCFSTHREGNPGSISGFRNVAEQGELIRRRLSLGLPQLWEAQCVCSQHSQLDDEKRLKERSPCAELLQT